MVKSLIDQGEAQYQESLRTAASTDVTAWGEYLDEDWFPAKHHAALCDKLMGVWRGDVTRLAISMPPGSAKALALDTPIPTPDGWKNIGDIRVGDRVFDENGQPCNVTWVSPIWRNRPVYTVRTDCGDEIIADEDHEWLVRLCRKRPVFKIKKTKELCRRRAKRPMIKRAKALETPDIDLPIDPYLLGVWLGDGTSSCLRITSSLADQPWLRGELERLGYKTGATSVPTLFSVLGVRDKFNKLGLINAPYDGAHGHKHIPLVYLRASRAQRLALLQGLVDTDGTVCSRRGSTTFCNTNREIAEGFRELVRSLGVKAGWSEGRATLYGVDHGPVYRVSFYMKGSARLPRKAELTRDQYRTPNTYIDVTPASIADTVCIEVDSESHLFLCGRSMTPTHNSTWSSHVFPSFYIGTKPESKFIQAAHTQDFADTFGKRVRSIVQSDKFKLAFPGVELSADSKAAGFWQLNNAHGQYLTRGVGGGIAGFRASVASVDDPIPSREAAESQAYRNKLYDWFTADFYTRLLPNAPLYIVATRWHPDDLIGRLEVAMKNGGEHYEIINFPAIAEENDPLGRAPGEALWPEFFTLDILLNLKQNLPPRDWSSLYQGQPYIIGGSIVQESWLQNIYEKPPEPTETRRIFCSVDCANSTTQRSDYTVITTWAEDLNKKFYLLDVARERVDFAAMAAWINEKATHHKANAILVEDAGAGKQLLQLYAGKLYAPLLPISVNNKGKEFRFDAISPLFASGQVLLPRRAVWLDDYIRELTEFPSGKHDDQVDSTSQALAWARGSGVKRGTRKIRGHTLAS